MIVRMKKLCLIGLLSEQETVLEKIQQMGQVQFVGEQKSGKLAPLAAASEKRGEIAFCIEFLSKYRTKTRNLLASFNVVTRDLPESEADSLSADSARLEKAIADVRNWEKRLFEFSGRQNSISAELASLLPWEGVHEPLDALTDTKTTGIFTGSVLERDAGMFKSDIDACPGIAYEEAGVSGENFFYIVAVHKSSLSGWDEIAKKDNFTRADLSGFKGTASEAAARLSEENDRLAKEKQQLTEEIGKSDLLDYFEDMSDLIAIRGDLLGAAAQSEDTARCFVMEGWIPAESCDLLTGEIEKITPHFLAEFSEVEDTDEPPALVRNKHYPAYYEGIVDAFSHPNYRDVDPNTLVSIFYSIFFGMMLADVGYGTLLVLATGAALLFGKMKLGMRRLMGIFFYGGLSSILMGVLFGSYFGAAFFPPLLVNPLDEPLLMIGISLALGVAHLFSGYCAKAYKCIRDGDWAGAVFDQGFWMLFLTGLMLLLAPALIKGPSGAVVGTVGKWTAIVSAVVLLCTQGRSSKTIFGKIGGGLKSLYNVTGFVGDALSYTRLFALCLSSSIIGSVFNQMASLFGHKNIFSIICMVIVMLIGHSLNIALSLLSSYVHTNRLQYVEFLGKFFDGNGEEFTPLSKNTEYITVVPDRVVRNDIN